ncbi:MAG: class I SAM-dependent methyltransferase [Solirubrobacteraceae bacterium]
MTTRRARGHASSREQIAQNDIVLAAATSERGQDLTRPGTVATRTPSRMERNLVTELSHAAASREIAELADHVARCPVARRDADRRAAADGEEALERHNRCVGGGSHIGWRDPAHALGYLARADTFPHRAEGEGVLLDHVPLSAGRILDLGIGDGRLLDLLRRDRPASFGVGVDVSEPMLEAAQERFADQPRVELVRHDLAEPIPDVGTFDAVISCFAIHHLRDARKRALYAEVFDRLLPGGVFCNLEHVASPTSRLHEAFYQALGYPPDFEDPSNHLLDVETQLGWLRDVGFSDVDCYWKWLEMALLIGVKSVAAEAYPIGPRV